jgi:hypothetical protein
MVGGLDGRYRIEADALVGAVQAPVVHAESGGSGDAQPGEVVPDVGRSCDLATGASPARAAPFSSASRSGEPSGRT